MPPTLRHLGRGSASLPPAYASLQVPPPLFLRTADNTKAQVVVAVRRQNPVAVRRPAVVSRVEPAAAAIHPARARCSTTRVRHATTRVITIPILTPLINIAVHIIKPPSIGQLAADWMCLSTRVLSIPSGITQLRFIISKTVLCRCPCTAGIFSFCFGGQTINITCCFLRR